MRPVPLFFPFSLALFAALFFTVFFPYLHLLPFIPFLAILYHRSSFPRALWIASLSGLIIDLLSSDIHFGLHALNYCLTTLLLYHQKRHFFHDKPLALSLFTALISSLSTLLQWMLITLFSSPFPLSWKSALSDFLFMPCVDGCYAFFWFSCPMLLYLHIQKIGFYTLWKRLLSLLPWKKEEVAQEEHD